MIGRSRITGVTLSYVHGFVALQHSDTPLRCVHRYHSPSLRNAIGRIPVRTCCRAQMARPTRLRYGRAQSRPLHPFIPYAPLCALTLPALARLPLGSPGGR